MVEGTRVDRLVSIDVAERYEALQDEVDLIKNEVKQTLVDLRGFMMEDRTLFPRIPDTGKGQSPPRIPAVIPMPEASPTGSPQASTGNGHIPGYAGAVNGNGLLHHVTDPLDVIMLGEIITWLGTVKRRGLSLHQITPYVEAYEAVGYLFTVVVKIILRSMADLDGLVEFSDGQKLSPEEYSECVREFHEIVTTKPIPADSQTPPADGQPGGDGPDKPEEMAGFNGNGPVSQNDEPESSAGQEDDSHADTGGDIDG